MDSQPEPVPAGPPLRAAVQRAADYYSLTKPGIVFLMLIATLATMMAAAGGRVPLDLTLVTLLGTALAAGGANAVNCFVDRDIDRLMSRTRSRPLPAGRVRPAEALAFGIFCLVASFAVLWVGVNPLAAAAALGGAAFYVFVYTLWLKRRSPQNIVIGGASGAVPPLIGWASATGHISLAAVALFAVIFLWTPPHFWALALYKGDDYRRAGVPMMPIVAGEAATKRQIVWYTAFMVAAALAAYLLGVGGYVYLAGSLALGVGYIALTLRALRDDSESMARRLFSYSILYLTLLFALLAFG